MHFTVSYDSETSDHAGAGGMFQIESVIEEDSGEDRTDEVDVGMHFNDEDEVLKYMKSIFGDDTTIESD